MTALITPFTDGGEVDDEALIRLVGHQQEGGTDVLVPLGTTGEAAVMSDQERRGVLGTIRQLTDLPLIAGAGTNDTRTTIENCRMVADEGAGYALVVGPYYNKPPQEGYLRHYEAVADASPVPIVIYNVPSRTGGNIGPDTVLRLAPHPNIVAVKEASGDLGQVSKIVAGRPDGFSVLSGDDALTLPILALGGDGVISVAANAAPREVREFVHAGLAGEFDLARSGHYRLLPLFAAAFTQTNPIPIKAGAALLGLCGPHVRLPLVSASEQTRETMRTALASLGLLPA